MRSMVGYSAAIGSAISAPITPPSWAPAANPSDHGDVRQLQTVAVQAHGVQRVRLDGVVEHVEGGDAATP